MVSILKIEFCDSYESKKKTQNMGNRVVINSLRRLSNRSCFPGVVMKINEYNNYQQVFVSNVLILSTDIDASITLDYESTAIESMNHVDITKKPKVSQLLSIIHNNFKLLI
jgi:hypothetical protein